MELYQQKIQILKQYSLTQWQLKHKNNYQLAIKTNTSNVLNNLQILAQVMVTSQDNPNSNVTPYDNSLMLKFK